MHLPQHAQETVLSHVAVTVLKEGPYVWIVQPIEGDVDDHGNPIDVRINLTPDQCVAVADALLKAAKRRKSDIAGGTDTYFDSFWQEYPPHRRVAKDTCRAIWKRGNLDAHHQQIADDLSSKKTSDDWMKNKGMYVPQTTTYLRQKRWESDAPVAPRFDV